MQGQEGQKGETAKGPKESFNCDGCVSYLNGGDDFMGTYIC